MMSIKKAELAYKKNIPFIKVCFFFSVGKVKFN